MSPPTWIIAEAGVNHNGDPEMADALVVAAADAGADAVKFQSFRADQMTSRHAAKAAYQARTTDAAETQFEMIRRLELSEADHRMLIDRARERGIAFLSTPFDRPSLEMLTRGFGLQTVKISSGDLTNAPFLLAVARASGRVLLSTGMSTLAEVEAALGALAFGFVEAAAVVPVRGDFERAFASDAGRGALADRVTLLHCTTEYPAPFDEVNLRAMETMAAAFGLAVGYSDHTPGIHVSMAAVARGARVIEKHFTLDRTLPGPDHKASLEPVELADLVRCIRQVELALGDGVKRQTPSEWKNREVARKSLVAAVPIAAGDVFTERNVDCKRPGTGIAPGAFWDVLGRVAARSYAVDEMLDG